MLLPPASQAAVSSTPKPKQASPLTKRLSPLVSDTRGSQAAEAVHCALYRERELASYGGGMASYYLPLLVVHHQHCIAVALLHARCDACCVLLNPLSSLPPRVPLSPTVQVSEHR
jgi:hypothetical protein